MGREVDLGGMSWQEQARGRLSDDDEHSFQHAAHAQEQQESCRQWELLMILMRARSNPLPSVDRLTLARELGLEAMYREMIRK